MRSSSPASTSRGKVRNCVAMVAVLFTTVRSRGFLSRITRPMSRLYGSTWRGGSTAKYNRGGGVRGDKSADDGAADSRRAAAFVRQRERRGPRTSLRRLRCATWPAVSNEEGISVATASGITCRSTCSTERSSYPSRSSCHPTPELSASHHARSFSGSPTSSPASVAPSGAAAETASLSITARSGPDEVPAEAKRPGAVSGVRTERIFGLLKM